MQNNNFTTQVKLKKNEGYFKQLVEAFIRPPRQQYTLDKLGPQTLLVNKLLIHREDFIVLSRNELIQLQCSLYTPVYLKDKPRPCVIYLHGNSSSRLESTCYANMFCAEGISLLNFDFGGSGNSGGQYVTLGWYEKVDFLAVLDYIKENYPLLGPFGAWGRSMGAVTAIMGGLERNDIQNFVLDSPFSNLKQLCIDIGDNFHVPELGVRFAFYLLRKKVRLLANYDPKHIDSLSYIKKMNKKNSIMFIRASSDKMIGGSHVDTLYEAFKGEKYIVTFPGDHNSGRPLEVYSMIIKFFTSRLLKPQSIVQLQKSSKPPSKNQSRKNSVNLKNNSNNNNDEKQKVFEEDQLQDSDLNYDESDDEKASRKDPDKYVPQKQQQLHSLNRFNTEDSEDLRYDEELSDHELPQFQDIHTKNANNN